MNFLRILGYTISTLFLILITILIHQHKDIDKAAHYIKSENCADCHENYYQAWDEHSLHSKMFRPIASPDDIQADFSVENPVVTFKKSDIEFVIGNKWEQVYARKIDDEYYPLPAKWMITTQKWVPYKVDSWRQTPLSTHCNGCHTTGFNPDNFQFSEFSIGCEACHGPGSRHVKQKQKKQSTYPL